ncbi:MAG: hypothetical protein ACOVRN_13005 [Flavobacterium sp.]
MKKILFLLVIAFTTVSCTTYTIPPEDFKAQLYTATDTIPLKDVTISTPILYASRISYKANTIKQIEVTDKEGLKHTLENSPAIEMRVTLKNGKRKTMYFDTVYLKNDTLFALKSKLIQSLQQKIPFADIVKIEVQDSGKDYKYQ